MGLLKEFKEFALRGNVMDMAVGFIIGAAFGKIVSSVVNDMIMPVVGKITSVSGKALNFKDKFYPLGELPDGVTSYDAAQKAGVPVLAYGSFIQTILDFTILAFCVFLMVKAMNMLMKKKEEAPAKPAETPADVKLLTEIRDLLARRA